MDVCDVRMVVTPVRGRPNLRGFLQMFYGIVVLLEIGEEDPKVVVVVPDRPVRTRVESLIDLQRLNEMDLRLVHVALLGELIGKGLVRRGNQERVVRLCAVRNRQCAPGKRFRSLEVEPLRMEDGERVK